MHDFVGCLPDKDLYFDQVLRLLQGSGDTWDAVLAFDGHEEAKRALYASYDPGPRMAELIAIDFLHLDGIQGLLFAAEKMGALLVRPKEVDQGYLLSRSLEICGEQATWDALREAGATNPRIEKYRSTAWKSSHVRPRTPNQPSEITSLTYEQLSNEAPFKKPLFALEMGRARERSRTGISGKGVDRRQGFQTATSAFADLCPKAFSTRRTRALASGRYRRESRGIRGNESSNSSSPTRCTRSCISTRGRPGQVEGRRHLLIGQHYAPGDLAIVLRWF
jgi:hypothetical protein